MIELNCDSATYRILEILEEGVNAAGVLSLKELLQKSTKRYSLAGATTGGSICSAGGSADAGQRR
jgi:hypothetical protein